ncbi:MAG: hypothetical protein V1808_04190 [Candidatus Daviesbacteria bacterium]
MIFRQPLIERKSLVEDSTSTAVNWRRIPAWNTAGRPKNAKVGTFGFNFQAKNLEYWNGTRWLKLRMKKI